MISFFLGATVLTGLLWAGSLLRLPMDDGGVEGIALTAHSSATIPRQQQLDHPIAATMTGAVDCNWVNALVAPTYGAQLYEGQTIQLESGLAQLTFESGAKLIDQGSAECTINSDMLLALDVGKLTAVVPRQASGFTVMTPSAEIVDFGTEFGVQVDPSGEVEVHVFDGEVVSRPLDEHGQSQDKIVRLVEEEAIRFDRTAAVPEKRTVDRNRFVRGITPRLSEDELPPLPVNKQLTFWLAADVRVQTDDQNRVIAWHNLLTEDNQTEEDAWQQDPTRRPIWIENAIGGKPALRFDGKSTGLLTTTYVYDRANNRARMILNGTVQECTTALGAAACSSRKAIGYHPRLGHVSISSGISRSFVLFNAALGNKQLDALHQYLGNKYQIEVMGRF